jgi:polyferredoxin
MNLIPVRDITALPRTVSGRHTRWRTGLGTVLVLVFLSLPWWRWQGQQALWLDVAGRRLQVFGAVFWPDDLNLLALALIVAAFALFWVTIRAGRVWCGYACPHTLWTAMFVWCERVTQGRRLTRHLLWLALGAVTALTLVGLFVPIRQLLPGVVNGTLGAAAWVWLAGIALVTCVNAGWLREHLCVYLCPYARFQAVMFDTHTPVVSYDRTRDDCVQCTLCVQVCPTGIDIRKGLQIACIACGACVDACEGVMAKVKRPVGLIAYRSEAGQGRHTRRPRLVGYGVLLIACAAWLAHGLATRPLMTLSVSKDRQLYRDRGDGHLENLYSLTLMNKTRQPRTYALSATGPQGLEWQGATRVNLAPGAQWNEVVSLALAAGQAVNAAVVFKATDEGSPATAPLEQHVDSRFTGPAQ